MKSHRTFRIDKIFGLATLISIMAMAIMIYNDYFKGTVDISGVFGKDSQEETRTSEYLNDKSTEQTTEPENDRIVICLDAAKGGSESGLMSGSKKEKDIASYICNKLPSKNFLANYCYYAYILFHTFLLSSNF